MLLQRWQRRQLYVDNLRRALSYLLASTNSNSSPLLSSSTSTNSTATSVCYRRSRLLSTFSSSLASRASGGSKSDDILASLIDHEKTGVPAGAGVAGEKGFDLSRMHRLLARLGNPHARIPATVHVVGSKGKGSIAAMVAACAGAARLRVAALTSPHVRDRRERISFGGGMVPISEAEFEALVEANADALRAAAAAEEEEDEEEEAEEDEKEEEASDLVDGDGGSSSNSRRRRKTKKKNKSSRLSSFEVMIALGFKAAADRRCDVAVIEAGLGGITDATNIFGGEGASSSFSSSTSSTSATASAAPPPSAVVLSAMSLEHASALGGTLESVVNAKCGVLRRGVPAVLARQEVARVAELARERVARAGALLVDAAAASAAAAGDGSSACSSSSTFGSVAVASCELLPSRGKGSPPRTKVVLRCSGELEGAFFAGGGFGGGGGTIGNDPSSPPLPPPTRTIEAELRLFGRHQADNAAAAAAAALSLSTMMLTTKKKGDTGVHGSTDDVGGDSDLERRRRDVARAMTPEAISKGLSGATLTGRFQVARLRLDERGGVRWSENNSSGGGSSSSSQNVEPTPRPSIPVVLDGAHTPESAAALARALSSAWPPRRGLGDRIRQPKLGVVLACASDKDHRGIAAALRSPPSSAPEQRRQHQQQQQQQQQRETADGNGGDGGDSRAPPPLRPSVVVFTEAPVAGSSARSAPPGELAAAWQSAAMREPIPGPTGRCRTMLKASLAAAVDAAARELAALAAVEEKSSGSSGGGGRGGGAGLGVGEAAEDEDEGDYDAAVLVVTGSLHAVGEALRILPLDEVVAV